MATTADPMLATDLITKLQPDADIDTRRFRVLFLCWSELDIISGTPMVVRDLLGHFPPGDAEAIIELNVDNKQHRQAIDLRHPVNKFTVHARLWPFQRGHRLRNTLARLATPALVTKLVWHIRRFRPDCLFAIYAQPHWILASWIAARLTGVPLIYHVHDAFLESSAKRKNSRWSQWLERTTLSGSRVLVLDDHVAQHYKERYGIRCTVLRHIVRHTPYPRVATPALGWQATGPASGGDCGARQQREMTIGFSGAIYDSNARQLAELCRLVAADPSLRLRIRTGSKPSQLEPLGIGGRGVEIAFAADYEQMLADMAQCDLLYLPLHFHKGEVAAEGAMEFSLPTKSFDYLLSGVPILVHCPAHFSLSRFFRRYPCAYVLNEPGADAVRQWLDAWRAGQISATHDDVRLRTLQMCTPEENKRILWQVLAEETAHKKPRACGGSNRKDREA